jgi:hypothetical protein
MIKKGSWAIVAGIFILCLASIVPARHTLTGEFVSDDFVLIHAANTIDMTTLFTANWLGEKHSGGFYRPVIGLFWKLDRLIYGDYAPGYHLTNYLFHLGVILLIAGLIYRIQGNGLVAVLSGVLFAVHPVHTEAVAWISGRTDLIAAFFYLLSIHAYLSATKGKRFNKVYFTGSILAGLMSMLSKEIAFTLPFMIAVLDYLIVKNPSRVHGRIMRILPFFLLLGICLIFRGMAIGSMLGGYGAQKHLRIDGVILSYLRHYLGWLLVPLGIAVERGSTAWNSIMSAFLILSFLPVFSRRYRPACLWFWISVLPVLTICRPQYIYLPSIGFVWLVILLITGPRLKEKSILEKICRGVLFAGLVFSLAFTTISQNREWERTGWIGAGIREILFSLHPNPSDTTPFVFVNPPVNRKIPIGLFQNGLTEAIRLWYKIPELKGMKVQQLGQLDREQLRTSIVIRFEKEKLFDLTNQNESTKFCNVWSCEGLPCRMDAASPAFVCPGSEKPVSGIIVESQLSNAIWIEQNEPIAEIYVSFVSGDSWSGTLRAGIHTSEWAIDKRELSGKSHHKRAPIAYSYISGIAGEIPFPGHTFQADFSWEQTRMIESIKIIPVLPERGSKGEHPEWEIRAIRGVRHIL